jgi:hypothetical protein
VSVDSNKFVAMTGYFTGSINLGGTLLSGSGLDVFAAKYDSAGTHQWSKRFGGFDTQIGNGIAMSPGGNVSVTGYFSNTLDLGSGVMTSLGGYDAFVGSIGP